MGIIYTRDGAPVFWLHSWQANSRDIELFLIFMTTPSTIEADT